jgi:hypothetical protein
MKAQMELFNLAIATALTMLLVVLGILWYATQSMQEEGITRNVAFLAASLPEWQCSYKGQTTTGCIDLLRAAKLGGDYFSLFGYSIITVEYVTEDWQKERMVIYSNQKKGFVEKRTMYVPVNVYDARTSSFLAGSIKAEVYR